MKKFMEEMYNICKILLNFDKIYIVMDEAGRRLLMESLIDEDMSLSLDKDNHIGTVCLPAHKG